MDSQVTMNVGPGLEESQVQEPRPCGGGLCHHPGTRMCSPTWKLCTLSLRGVVEVHGMIESVIGHWSIVGHLNLISNSSLLSGGQGVGLTIPTL